jgi:hypothetical protein
MRIGSFGSRGEVLDIGALATLEQQGQWPQRPLPQQLPAPDRSIAIPPPPPWAPPQPTSALPSPPAAEHAANVPPSGLSMPGLLNLTGGAANGGGAAALFADPDSGGASAAAQALTPATEPEEPVVVTEDAELGNRLAAFEAARAGYEQRYSFLNNWRVIHPTINGSMLTNDMNGMLEYIAEWDLAHLVEPRWEDFLMAEDPFGAQSGGDEHLRFGDYFSGPGEAITTPDSGSGSTAATSAVDDEVELDFDGVYAAIDHPADDGGGGTEADTAVASEEVQQVVVTGSRTSSDTSAGAGGSSIYPDLYLSVPGTTGVMPVGGHENLQLARDLPTLPAEFTPTLPDGRPGAGVPYRDQTGQVFYLTFDAAGDRVGWISAPVAVPAPPAIAELASAADVVFALGAVSGSPHLQVAGGIGLFIGAAWWALDGADRLQWRQALSPEELQALQAPMVNVPESPVAGGTPGYVADHRDTSTPGYQVPDVRPPWDAATESFPAAPETTIDDLIVTRNPDGNPPKPDFVPSRTVATGVLGGVPEGYVSDNPNNERGIDRENEAAAAAAGWGYRVVQNPTLTPAERISNGISESAAPDLLIEGRVFDVKSSLSAAAAQTAISDSVTDKQARRFLINANDFGNPEQEVRDLAARLRDHPPEGLQEVKVLVNGVIRNIFP